jgi:hypothetical protein
VRYGSVPYTGNETYTGDGKEGVAKTITTDYFSGEMPAITQLASKYFGTFANGYQPKGIPTHGKLTKTGETIEVRTTTLSGEKKPVTQNIWKAEDGTLWYWEGREMMYKQYKESETKKMQYQEPSPANKPKTQNNSTNTNSRGISYTPISNTKSPYLPIDR